MFLMSRNWPRLVKKYLKKPKNCKKQLNGLTRSS
nr:MAG TPA: hypothetical protein [Caudoviricetes sp.]DAY31912.1 MAG TPA: hypothetical protein [Caudoviricetes sp.]